MISGVLVDNGKRIRAIFETGVLPNGLNLALVLTLEADRIRDAQSDVSAA
jgi:hypothetical protein